VQQRHFVLLSTGAALLLGAAWRACQTRFCGKQRR